MTVDELGRNLILEVVHFPDAQEEYGVNFRVTAWSEKRQERLIMTGWITPDLVDDPVAFRAHILLSLEDAEADWLANLPLDSAQEALDDG